MQSVARCPVYSRIDRMNESMFAHSDPTAAGAQPQCYEMYLDMRSASAEYDRPCYGSYI